MNSIILVMALFALLGLMDKALGGRMKLAPVFDKGFNTAGGLALSTVGFYSIGVTLVRNNSAAIANFVKGLPFDPAAIIGCLLAPDMGGLMLCREVAQDPLAGSFGGIFLTASVGMTLCFQIPVFLTAVKDSARDDLMHGFLFGFMGIPFGVIPAGLLLGLPLKDVMWNMLPAAVVCLLPSIGYLFAPKGTVKILKLFGRGVSILSFVLFALACVGMFSDVSFADAALIQEMMYYVLRMVIVASGGLVLSSLLLRFFHSVLDKIAHKAGINSTSVVGLLMSFMQSLAMLPLYENMDRRGKIVNAAFSAAGAYCIGGQFAYVAGLCSQKEVTLYILSKLTAGAAGVIIALLLTESIKYKGENL